MTPNQSTKQLFNFIPLDDYDREPEFDSSEESTMKREEVQSWENEGGEVPAVPIPHKGK